MLKLVVLAVALGVTHSKDFIFVNRHPGTIWVGALGNAGILPPSNGGFELGSGQQRTVSTADNWAGRFWARTGCNPGNHHCETGDCGNKLECAGAGGVPPVTLVEFTLNGHEGLDYYDVSLVDGFNVAAERTVSAPDNWAGRFWARTGCNPGNSHCQTGDCGNKLQCAGAGGNQPVTLVEFILNGERGLDYYDVSLVDGFNVAAEAQPVNGEGGGKKYDCGVAGCSSNLNLGCPQDLRMYSDSGALVGCDSSCIKFNTDQYCCRGSYDTPHTCKINDWPVNNSASYFQANCPNARSYAYDTDTRISTYTCRNSDYRITFY